jgi:hypothetical protein
MLDDRAQFSGLVTNAVKEIRKPGTIMVFSTRDSLVWERSAAKGIAEYKAKKKPAQAEAIMAKAREDFRKGRLGHIFGAYYQDNIVSLGSSILIKMIRLIDLELYIYDSSYAPPPAESASSGSKRRIGEFQMFQRLAELVAEIDRTKKARIDEMFITGGGNDNNQCFRMTMEWVRRMVLYRNTSDELPIPRLHGNPQWEAIRK